MPFSSPNYGLGGTSADPMVMLAQHACRAYQGMRQIASEGMRSDFRAYIQGQAEPCRLRHSVAFRRSKTLAFAFCAALTLAALAAAYAMWPPSARKDGRNRQRRVEDDRFTRSLAGLAAAFLLLVVGLWLTERLADLSKLDDCMLQGRSNCERIELSVIR